ncbi:hypothetical protein [Mesorhizobium sp. P5_C1]
MLILGLAIVMACAVNKQGIHYETGPIKNLRMDAIFDNLASASGPLPGHGNGPLTQAGHGLWTGIRPAFSTRDAKFCSRASRILPPLPVVIAALPHWA